MQEKNGAEKIPAQKPETQKKVSQKHQINIPSDWWSSQNSYDHLLNKPKPGLRIIKSPKIISVIDAELPKVKGWDVKNGDYRVKVDEPERDFKKDKKQFKYKMFIAAVALALAIMWIVATLVSNVALGK